MEEDPGGDPECREEGVEEVLCVVEEVSELGVGGPELAWWGCGGFACCAS